MSLTSRPRAPVTSTSMPSAAPSQTQVGAAAPDRPRARAGRPPRGRGGSGPVGGRSGRVASVSRSAGAAPAVRHGPQPFLGTWARTATLTVARSTAGPGDADRAERRGLGFAHARACGSREVPRRLAVASARAVPRAAPRRWPSAPAVGLLEAAQPEPGHPRGEPARGRPGDRRERRLGGRCGPAALVGDVGRGSAAPAARAAPSRRPLAAGPAGAPGAGWASCGAAAGGAAGDERGGRLGQRPGRAAAGSGEQHHDSRTTAATGRRAESVRSQPIWSRRAGTRMSVSPPLTDCKRLSACLEML